MSNQYGLPENELEAIRKRDKKCIYCHKEMFKPNKKVWRGDWATIEHLNHLPPWNNSATVAICCGSCNSSRGNKTVTKWFASNYCIEKNINPHTVAQSVLEYIRNYEDYRD